MVQLFNFIHFSGLVVCIAKASTSSSKKHVPKKIPFVSKTPNDIIGIPSLLQSGTIRGGGNNESGDTTTPYKEKPDWLDIDHETLQKYLSIASQRHDEAVKAAREAYWSTYNREEKWDDESSSSSSTVKLDTHGINTNNIGSWSLPDFSNDLDTSKMIFVTHGSSAEFGSDSDAVKASTPLFSVNECNAVIENAESYFTDNSNGKWTTLPSGQYDVAGFWIKDVPKVHNWFNDMLKERLFPLLVEKFPNFVNTIDDLVVDNAYLFKYTPETGRRTGVHTDSGCLSFTIALNSPEEYTGGGTWFEHLVSEDGTTVHDSKLEMGQGHVTVRPGGVRHCGHAVTDGTRYIIGGFCMHCNKVEYVRMLIGYGSDLAAQGNYKQAAEALEAAISINPNFDGAYTHLSSVLEKLGNKAKAKKVLEYCFRSVNRINGEVAYSLGIMYLADKQYKEARTCFEACVEVDDLDYQAMIGLAQVCASESDSGNEIKWYERVVNTPGVAKYEAALAYCNLGVLNTGDYEKELKYYEKALDLVPNNFQSRFSLASAHASRQDWEMAAESFRLAVQLASEDEDTHSQTEALNALYRVAVNIVRAKQVATQAEQMKLLIAIVGEANYQLLASGSSGKA